jgi:hypothetical protein
VPGLQPQLGAQPVTNAANPAQPMSLGERRRAARAAELARERAEAEARVKAGAAADPPQGNAGSEAPSSPLPALPRVPPGQDPRWQQLYQRYQNRLAPPSDSQ